MNKLFAALLLALPLCAQAQQKPAKPAEAEKAAAPAPDPAEEVIGKLKAWDSALKTLEADFTQEVTFTEAGLKQSIEGKLNYSRPNLLRIEHLKPARQLVVTDKTDIWIYKPADKQAVKTAWSAWRRSQDQNFSGILDFGNYSALLTRNTAEVSGGGDKPWKIVFTPRSGARYSLALTLSPEDYFPQEAELSVEGTVILTRLSGVRKNAEADPKLFKFTPPKGTEILEFKQ